MRLKFVLSTGLVSFFLLTFPALAEDPFLGRIHAIESAARALATHSSQVAPSIQGSSSPIRLSWGQQLASEDLKVLSDKARDLRSKIDEGKGDLEQLDPEIRALVAAMAKVRISLSTAKLDGDGQAISSGLLVQMNEVEQTLDRSQSQSPESKIVVRQSRNPYSGYPDWGDPYFGWGTPFGNPWGWNGPNPWGYRNWGYGNYLGGGYCR